MAKTRECCSALSLMRPGDDLHVSLHKGFKIRLAGIVPVSLCSGKRNSYENRSTLIFGQYVTIFAVVNQIAGKPWIAPADE